MSTENETMKFQDFKGNVLQEEKKQSWFENLFNEKKSTEVLFACIAITMFLLCVYFAYLNNLTSVPMGILSLYAYNAAMAKRLS